MILHSLLAPFDLPVDKEIQMKFNIPHWYQSRKLSFKVPTTGHKDYNTSFTSWQSETGAELTLL
jgi:hypothetical protein